MRTRTAHLLLGLALAGSLAACSDDSEPVSTISTGCVDGTIEGAGSTAQKNAVDEWVKAYQLACPNSTINYQPVGSGAGITQFIAGTTQFAGSDSLLKDTEVTDATIRCNGPVKHLPMVVGPIAVAYNVEGVDTLNLSPSTLASIFAGEIINWNDPRITADNGGRQIPATPIQAFHRSDESGTTDNFTKYLAGAATWNYETGKAWRAPGGQGAKGSDGVTAAVKQTDGSIGYVEWSYAANSDLDVADINQTQLSEGNVALAVDQATVTNNNGDITVAIDYTSTGYPLTLLSYEIVCDNTDPLVKSFLLFTSSTEGQNLIADLKYVPLPGEIKSQVVASVDSLA